jgi:[citrate (pro-3S)-lyase] ligase
MNGNFTLTYGYPFSGERLSKTRAFLKTLDLNWDEQIAFTVNVMQGGKIVATGSRRENILECFGVAKDLQGEGLTATVLSELLKNAHENGYGHLFIFTKPESSDMFEALDFSTVARTKDVVLLENKKDGVKKYVASLNAPAVKNAGAIVMNCNPFTNGHLYLITTAAKQCGKLFIFVVSEDKSFFSAADRFAMVKAGTAHLANVEVYPSGPYLISSATFPSYFMKETVKSARINCELDLTVFSDCFAAPLGITIRFVGTEPNDP